jgi:hypothetical protein
MLLVLDILLDDAERRSVYGTDKIAVRPEGRKFPLEKWNAPFIPVARSQQFYGAVR